LTRELPGSRNVSGHRRVHSLGEIASLAAAGSIPWETALLLVNRSEADIMAQASHEQAGGMIAIVGLDEAAVERSASRLQRTAGCGSPNRIR